MDIARLQPKQRLCFLFMLLLGCLLLPLTAQAKGGWVPSVYQDDQLNTETFCTLRTDPHSRRKQNKKAVAPPVQLS